MKPIKMILIVVGLLWGVWIVTGCSQKSIESILDQDKAQQQALDYVAAFAKGNDDEALMAVVYDKAMQNAFPKSAMSEVRGTIESQYGTFVKQTGLKTTTQGDYFIVSVGTEYENKPLVYNVTFNNRGELSGFHYIEIASVEDFFSLETATHDEEKVSFGNDKFPLTGVLTLPEGEGPFPAVIVVHGSGPNDKDGTVFGNKPYFDLAKGLSEQGVAVLRYDKRTLTYGSQLSGVKDFTIYDEVIDDAVYAYQFLSKEESIKADSIYILGHSLGANQAPRIALKDKGIAGVVLLAGYVTPLQDIMLKQFQYLAELTEGISKEEKEQMSAVKKSVDYMNSELFSEASDPSLSFGIPYFYWKDLIDYSPIDDALQLNRPILVVQGERDYQVTVSEFELWKKGLGDKAEFLLYPKLNHLMIAGEGPSGPDEYRKAGKVDDVLIKDLADWIKKH